MGECESAGALWLCFDSEAGFLLLAGADSGVAVLRRVVSVVVIWGWTSVVAVLG